MGLNIVRQDRSKISQRYFVPLGKDSLEISYSTFSYPSEEDKPLGNVDASLVININYSDSSSNFKDVTTKFHDIIYHQNGFVSLKVGGLGYSPAMDVFSELEEKVKEEILGVLSSEARSLLEKGLREYERVKL